MISLGTISYDSADSGKGTIEVLSEGDNMWIRVRKAHPELESHRPSHLRDPQEVCVVQLSNRTLDLIGFKKRPQIESENEQVH